MVLCDRVAFDPVVVPTPKPDDRSGGELRFCDLRHTAVALWIAAGASPKEVAVRASHASVVTVLDRYGHLLPGTEDRVNDALDLMVLTAAGDNAEVIDLTSRAVS